MTVLNYIVFRYNLGRGDDAVGNPHRAQISQFELFDLTPLLKLDKQFSVERFEPTVSQSTVSSPPLMTGSDSHSRCLAVNGYTSSQTLSSKLCLSEIIVGQLIYSQIPICILLINHCKRHALCLAPLCAASCSCYCHHQYIHHS